MICCQKLDDFRSSQMPSYAKGSCGSCPGELQNGRRDPLLRAAGERTPPGAGACHTAASQAARDFILPRVGSGLAGGGSTPRSCGPAAPSRASRARPLRTHSRPFLTSMKSLALRERAKKQTNNGQTNKQTKNKFQTAPGPSRRCRARTGQF
ncbi:PREDICTED: uncharacterized protein LOC105505052 [Colobus angolensis palliatus]|uniref:uncharacterized protein LOC105505052 n=1 Tax=Colobus angolensis palliatus TaxID=336983 RepID=UPI0005F42FBE|nr:PREDICTED: uncharacterized protein LOC105505052 [Colobus angolensis palliatus]